MYIYIYIYTHLPCKNQIVFVCVRVFSSCSFGLFHVYNIRIKFPLCVCVFS